MTPAQAIEMHQRMLAELGEDVLVRRWSGPSGARVKTEVEARARVTGYAPREMVGSIAAGDRRVIMLVDKLSALLPLTNSDKIVVRGRELAIKAVDDNTRRIGGTLVALEIQAAG